MCDIPGGSNEPLVPPETLSALSRPEHRRRVHLLSPCLSITCRTFLRVTAVLGCLKWCQMVSDGHTFNWLRLTVTRLPITQTQPNEALKFLRALRIWDIHETCFFPEVCSLQMNLQSPRALFLEMLVPRVLTIWRLLIGSPTEYHWFEPLCSMIYDWRNVVVGTGMNHFIRICTVDGVPAES